MKSWVVKNHQCSFSRIKIYEMGYFNLEQCSFLARNCQWIYGCLRIKNPLDFFFFFFEKEEPIRFDVLIRREKIWETCKVKFIILTFFFFSSTINFENCNNVGYLDLMSDFTKRMIQIKKSWKLSIGPAPLL